MKYLINKKLWEEGNETVVKTEIGETVLRIERLKRTMRQRIQVYDRYHVPIGTIEKTAFRTGANFELHYDDRVIATVKNKWSFFGKKLVIVTSENTTFTIKGNFKQFEYTIKKGPMKYAHVSKKYGRHSGQFGVNTSDDKHRYIFICVAIALSTLVQ